MYDELDVFARIHAQVRRHAGDDQVLHGSGSEFGEGHRLSLQVANRADSVGPEQLRATDVARSQDDDWSSLVHLDDVAPDEVQGHVCFTGGKCLEDVGAALRRDVYYISKPLASQELFGGQKTWGRTNGPDLVHAEPPRLGRRLGKSPFRSRSDKPSCPASAAPRSNARRCQRSVVIFMQVPFPLGPKILARV